MKPVTQTTAAQARVVEISAFVACPLAGMMLAALGFDVLRVDPPGGGLDYHRWPLDLSGYSLFWAGLNRGKRSAALDIRRPEGCELAAAVITADLTPQPVYLTNLSLGGPLSYPRLAAACPDLISAEIVGHQDGRSGVDYTVAAQTGVPLVTGPEGHEGPINSPIPTWDLATGIFSAMMVHNAIVDRHVTGSGRSLRVALAEVAGFLLGSLGFSAPPHSVRHPRVRDGNYLYGAFGRDFVLGDSTRIMIVAITAKQWRALVEALDMEPQVRALEDRTGLQLVDEGDRFLARREIAEIIEPWCARRNASEAGQIFDARGVMWARYADASELPGPLGARSEAPGTPGGPELTLDAVGTGLTPAPRLGEHTEQVLAEVLKLSQSEIGRLITANLVDGPSLRRHGDDD